MEQQRVKPTDEQLARMEDNCLVAIAIKVEKQNQQPPSTLQFSTIDIADLKIGVGKSHSIKSRVISKEEISSYKNVNGQGQFIKFGVCDATGEISVIAFNDKASHFHEILQLGQVYVFNTFIVRQVHPDYPSLNANFQLLLTKDTQAILSPDDEECPPQFLNLKTIESIESTAEGSRIDVVGVCMKVGKISTVKCSGTGTFKIDVTLVDQTFHAVNVTLWGSQMQTFVQNVGCVLALKGVAVSSLNGKNLTCLKTTVIMINPPITQTIDLLEWYNSVAQNSAFINVSNTCRFGVVGCPWEMLMKQDQVNSID